MGPHGSLDPLQPKIPDGSDRQQLLQELVCSPFPVTIDLQHQPDNPYDPHAVAVLGPSGQLGYLSRDLAYSVSQMLDARYLVKAEITQITGTEELDHHYGANVCIYVEEPTYSPS